MFSFLSSRIARVTTPGTDQLTLELVKVTSGELYKQKDETQFLPMNNSCQKVSRCFSFKVVNYWVFDISVINQALGPRWENIGPWLL